jgi:hypothetical protein
MSTTSARWSETGNLGAEHPSTRKVLSSVRMWSN